MHTLRAYFQIARPSQYAKNAFIWLPLFFGHKIGDLQAISQTIWAFIAFCLVASSVYVLNDLKDVEEDREHPTKRFRPLPSGALEKRRAAVFLLLLLALSVVVSLAFLTNELLFVLGTYLTLNVAYSFFLKHIAIIDIACVASGFVLRVLAGGIAADVQLSHWIIIMTFLLALFLALAKRRDDLILLASGHNMRKSIDGYNMQFVTSSMMVMASVIIVAYILYTISPESIALHGTNKLYMTSLWVVLGLLRYMQITFVDQRSGSPTRVLLKDYFLQATIILWLINCYLLIYGLGFLIGG